MKVSTTLLLSGLGMLSGAATVAAQTPGGDFRPLPSPYAGRSQLTFWDAGSLRRDGDRAEVTVLVALRSKSTRYDHPGAPGVEEDYLFGWIQRWRLDCAQGTAQPLDSAAWKDSPAKAQPPAPDGRATAFVTPHGMEAGFLEAACGAASAARPAVSYPTAEAAVAAERAELTPLSPVPPPPPAPPGGAAVKTVFPALVGEPLKYQRMPGSAGVKAYVDWKGLQSEGSRRAVQTVWVLDEERRYNASIVMRRERYDCDARTVTVLGQAWWNRAGRQLTHDETVGPALAVSPDSPRAAVLEAVCRGKPRGKTLKTLGAVVEDALAAR